VDVSIRSKKLKSEMEINPSLISNLAVNFIREYTKKLERDGVILGLSGGVDSAVVAALCKRAVGARRTLALIMPERDSEKENIKDAIAFAKELKIKVKLIDMTPYLKEIGSYRLFSLERLLFVNREKGESVVKNVYNFYRRLMGEAPFLSGLRGLKGKKGSLYLGRVNAYYRIKHRMRMLLLYFYGEMKNKLVVGAANKTEYKIGYFVKHGCDSASDIMPILNLYKTQVKKLAQYLNIPSKIINKAPSPDIIPGITDEEAIGIPYEELDLVLFALEKGWGINKISKDLGIGKEQIMYIKHLIDESEHMRKIYSLEEETG